jgi:hypothetical protein
VIFVYDRNPKLLREELLPVVRDTKLPERVLAEINASVTDDGLAQEGDSYHLSDCLRGFGGLERAARDTESIVFADADPPSSLRTVA